LFNITLLLLNCSPNLSISNMRPKTATVPDLMPDGGTGKRKVPYCILKSGAYAALPCCLMHDHEFTQHHFSFIVSSPYKVAAIGQVAHAESGCSFSTDEFAGNV